MTQQQADELIIRSLQALDIKPPVPWRDDLSLMKDIKLESIDIMNLFVEIERAIKGQIDLIELMRNRDADQVYQRDLRVGDLARFIEKRELR